MATYAYDDFRVTFTTRPDGGYDVHALSPDGADHTSTFTVPLPMAELQDAVVHMARSRSRAVHPGATREVAPADPASPDKTETIDAERLGAALADALFINGLGAAYDAARQASSSADRGLRLTLALEAAPALLSLPWEFLYRRPRFIASQRHTPLVRCLDSGSLAAPPAITKTVRILGVISSPHDLSPLDVDAERQHVETAVAKMVRAGRVELDWLEPATPRCLREALRDNSYHILHYVGHSSFTDAAEGAIYLADDEGQSVEVDNTTLANLLSDQTSLRLVVLNSCEGARTTLSDPYAGVATTLIQLGVPAVVAMQFEISDKAAILFADELYTNLIGRQDPIDAAVGEARKAIYIEIDRIEWATPVLFLRDPEVQLFDFKLPVAPLPPPPPAQQHLDDAADDESQPDLSESAADPEPQSSPESSPESSPTHSLPVGRRHTAPLLIAAGVVAAVLVIGVAVWAVTRDHATTTASNTTVTPSSASPTTEQATVATPVATTIATAAQTQGTGAPRVHTGFLSVQVLESDGETHLYPLDLATGQIGVITNKPAVTDTQAAWDRGTNRVAFTRERPAAGAGTGLFYVVPGDFKGDQGKQVAVLVPWTPGQFMHFPAWTVDGDLFYLRTDDCAPGPLCAEQLRRATFTAGLDSAGFRDELTIATDQKIAGGFAGVTAVATDPGDADRLVVVDSQGMWVVNNRQPTLVVPGLATTSVTFTGDGNFLVALVTDGDKSNWAVFDATSDSVANNPIIGDNPDLRFVSIAAEGSGRTLIALVVSALDPSVATVVRVQITDDGIAGVLEVPGVTSLLDLGTAQAVAL